ncbi:MULTISPECIES: aminotransferase class V-fold PLP-dependent enzyme [Brevibacterium]|uniref:Aminotransferase class V-fold PLP-dependent enzyme n=1 Tax=Brevibacterium salitolerans TaxID=1403566 RepID=A0ABP5I277_9MICO|nr:aminotransferase class V-fold PLP-dependent enzyme [Brevibacterium sp.]
MSSAARLRPFDPAVVPHLFAMRPGYLNAAALGLPFYDSLAALRSHLDRWEAGQVSATDFDVLVDRARRAYASLVGVAPERTAIGSQTSVQVSLLAQSLPAGSTVVTVDGDFSSVTAPFHVRPEVTVRPVPLADLAEALTPDVAAVVFSLVQSADGRQADAEAVRTAAREHGILTLCDLTQAAGSVPCSAEWWDMAICHTYKWLSCPRGLSFLTVSADLTERLVPAQAGWFAGADPWASTYGPALELAGDARRFDVSPAWPSVVGAVPVLEWFAQADIAGIRAHAAGLGDALCRGLGLPERGQAIVAWPDPDGSDLAALQRAGVTASGRAGGVRASFHVWSTEEDVDMALGALGR